MPEYKKILVAINLYAKENFVLLKALKIANKTADINLIYVIVPQVYLELYGASFETDFGN